MAMDGFLDDESVDVGHLSLLTLFLLISAHLRMATLVLWKLW